MGEAGEEDTFVLLSKLLVSFRLIERCSLTLKVCQQAREMEHSTSALLTLERDRSSNIKSEVQKGKTPMYARAITFQYQPGKMDEGLNILRETVVPELQQQPGFQGATNLVDRGNNKVVGITLWRSEADLQASGMSKLQARFAKVSSFLAAVPIVESYEVTDDQRC